MSTLPSMSHDVASTLNRPLRELPTAYELADVGQLREMVRELDGLIERAARVRAYLDDRATFGAEHTRAVKTSNRLANKVRKLLGYAYPSTVEF